MANKNKLNADGTVKVQQGDLVSDGHGIFSVEKLEERYNFRSQRRELHVIASGTAGGLVYPVARLTVIAGQITTC